MTADDRPLTTSHAVCSLSSVVLFHDLLSAVWYVQQAQQQILQELQRIEQENARLEQAIQEALEANQALDAEIEKIRPEVASLPLPPQ